MSWRRRVESPGVAMFASIARASGSQKGGPAVLFRSKAATRANVSPCSSSWTSRLKPYILAGSSLGWSTTLAWNPRPRWGMSAWTLTRTRSAASASAESTTWSTFPTSCGASFSPTRRWMVWDRSMTWQPSAWQPLTVDLVTIIFLQQSVFWATIDSGCWLGTGASCPDMLGGHKESPPDGQYLDWTDILWHSQVKKVRVWLLFSSHAVTEWAGWLVIFAFWFSCFSFALDLTRCVDCFCSVWFFRMIQLWTCTQLRQHFPGSGLKKFPIEG